MFTPSQCFKMCVAESLFDLMHVYISYIRDKVLSSVNRSKCSDIIRHQSAWLLWSHICHMGACMGHVCLCVCVYKVDESVISLCMNVKTTRADFKRGLQLHQPFCAQAQRDNADDQQVKCSQPWSTLV